MEIGVIEKEVPFPKANSIIRYPWLHMKKGDSVLIKPTNEGECICMLSCKVGSAARSYGQATGKEFKTLVSPHEGGVRVWRIN